MRLVKLWIAAAIMAAVFVLCLSVYSADKKKPELRQVIVYSWALDTGGSKVDFRLGKLDSFVRGVRLSDADRKQLEAGAKGKVFVYRINAALEKKELNGLREYVLKSGLRTFKPLKRDVKERDRIVQ